jgi:hypothetical protein
MRLYDGAQSKSDGRILNSCSRILALAAMALSIPGMAAGAFERQDGATSRELTQRAWGVGVEQRDRVGSVYSWPAINDPFGWLLRPKNVWVAGGAENTDSGVTPIVSVILG